MTLLSEIYGVGYKGNLRNKAKEGYIRPTANCLFTSADYTPLVATNDVFKSNSLNTLRWSPNREFEFSNGRIGDSSIGYFDTLSIQNNARIVGDFEVQVKVELSYTTIGYYGGLIYITDDHAGDFEIIRNNSGILSRITTIENHVNTFPSTVWLKMNRTETNVRTYYSTNNSSWTLVGNSNADTQSGYVSMRTTRNVNSGTLSLWFDDFKFNSGIFSNSFIIN